MGYWYTADERTLEWRSDVAEKPIVSTINGSFTITGTSAQVMNAGRDFEEFMKDIKESGLTIKHFRYDVNLSEEEDKK